LNTFVIYLLLLLLFHLHFTDMFHCYALRAAGIPAGLQARRCWPTAVVAAFCSRASSAQQQPPTHTLTAGAPRGTHDLEGMDLALHRFIIDAARRTAARYAFEEVKNII